ncbi:GNAT family N-acetyltransferase [Mangrovimonas sp. AS39]|uniref:GNAT family N-acetyltransferase n=1 Tax=Mangrovimonas futianensis TaxID=2895523 RepID=UPI001E2C65D5|nr:GNAT family N-acetyltransferase [Mangrovimonas futianensis]MCF1190136.1 GNAT family N-acetyltransferase [Mangrovimonas futianensis]MCF1194113.1 GNAT family N-acetyltransferase [Mangrovimonas futianensis]
MKIHIRKAEKNDMSQILERIKELAVFEKEPDAVEITVSDLEYDGFGPKPKFQCFVAEKEERIVGIALTYTRYSTWKGEVLHLEDLIVEESMRGHGIGTQLLDKVVQYGNELGVKRISWEVLDWNEPAISFYQSKGADVKRDWDVVHLDQNGIKNYLAKL